jgi:hypothetical protein
MTSRDRSKEAQIVQAFTSASTFARARLMDTIEDFDAWLYLRRIGEPEEFEFKVPKRFVKVEEVVPDRWPDMSRVAIRREAREHLR